MRPAKLPFALLLAFSLPGCALFSDAPHYRGNAITQHDLNELTPGIASQADVTALLGPPTFQEQFSPNNWVYLAQVTKMRIANTEGVKQQHVVVLSFDSSGVLQTVTEKGMDDRVTVAMDGAQTPVPGGHAGFIQQLIGGVGSPISPGAVATGRPPALAAGPEARRHC